MRPWHLWIVGVFFVLLNSAGTYDYVMTLGLQNADYFRSQGYEDPQITYFSGYPWLPAIFWTVGVWGALAASIMLPLRTRWAAPVASLSFVSQLCLAIATFGFMNRWHVFGPWQSLFDCAVLLLTAGLALYCRVMSARGVLR